jgi:DNA-binding NtrC family response regulator
VTVQHRLAREDSVVPSEKDKSKEQKAAEFEVESFRKDLGPFVVAAETTRMAMVFTDAKESIGPAGNVNQALAMIEAEAIDVAVLDINLNGQLSYPIADARGARGVSFVFVTGYDKGRILDGYRVFPVLQKPFHRSELSDILAKLLAPKEPRVESVTAAVAKTSP